MNGNGLTRRVWISAVVALHLVISIVHGAAHGGAHVPMSAAANLFVFVVILGGPLAGVAILWRDERAGSWLIAATMAGALVFGLVNHFVIPGADHVAQVADASRPMFTVTAALLAVTEALGAALALRAIRGTRAHPQRGSNLNVTST